VMPPKDPVWGYMTAADMREFGDRPGPFTIQEGYWVAGDGQPCPNVSVHDAHGSLVLEHECCSPLEEAFIRWAVSTWNHLRERGRPEVVGHA
jgi:hypothetical protein